MRICPRTVILDVNFASFKIAWYGLPKHFWQYLDSFQLLLYCKRERETTCLFVLAHPIVNSHFRYQSNTWVLDTKFDRVLVLLERSSRKKTRYSSIKLIVLRLRNTQNAWRQFSCNKINLSEVFRIIWRHFPQNGCDVYMPTCPHEFNSDFKWRPLLLTTGF